MDKLKAEIILNLKEDSTREDNIERLASLFNARLEEAKEEEIKTLKEKILEDLQKKISENNMEIHIDEIDEKKLDSISNKTIKNFIKVIREE